MLFRWQRENNYYVIPILRVAQKKGSQFGTTRVPSISLKVTGVKYLRANIVQSSLKTKAGGKDSRLGSTE